MRTTAFMLLSHTAPWAHDPVWLSSKKCNGCSQWSKEQYLEKHRLAKGTYLLDASEAATPNYPTERSEMQVTSSHTEHCVQSSSCTVPIEFRWPQGNSLASSLGGIAIVTMLTPTAARCFRLNTRHHGISKQWEMLWSLSHWCTMASAHSSHKTTASNFGGIFFEFSPVVGYWI